jgi:hypothetical protein
MEEGILLLDASLDEDIEQPPEENIPAEIPSPPSSTIVEGPNWKYDMGDLRMAGSEFTPLSSETLLMSIHSAWRALPRSYPSSRL